jgi:hypothetical protein
MKVCTAMLALAPPLNQKLADKAFHFTPLLLFT